MLGERLIARIMLQGVQCLLVAAQLHHKGGFAAENLLQNGGVFRQSRDAGAGIPYQLVGGLYFAAVGLGQPARMRNRVRLPVPFTPNRPILSLLSMLREI